MDNLQGKDQLSPSVLHHTFDPNGAATEASSSFWAPTLDPKNEERMPDEFRRWRRWSNRSKRDEALKLLDFDMSVKIMISSNLEPFAHTLDLYLQSLYLYILYFSVIPSSFIIH
jgi:hypothetical protein